MDNKIYNLRMAKIVNTITVIPKTQDDDLQLYEEARRHVDIVLSFLER